MKQRVTVLGSTGSVGANTLDVMAHQGEGGALSLAAVPTFATRWLIPRLPQLAQAHPDIVVHIDTQTRPFLFADTTFDAALYAGTPEQVANWPGVQAQLLMHEEVVPVCSPCLLESAAPRGRGRARVRGRRHRRLRRDGRGASPGRLNADRRHRGAGVGARLEPHRDLRRHRRGSL